MKIDPGQGACYLSVSCGLTHSESLKSEWTMKVQLSVLRIMVFMQEML